MARTAPLLAIAAALAIGPGCTPDADPPVETAAPLREPDVRYEPTPHRVVRQMLRLAEVGPGDVVYDLGSGDGRIPIAAAREFGARGVGIEIDPALVRRAEEKARKAGVTDRVEFRHADLFEADFGDATVVTLFLYPDVNMRLRPRLLAELAPGTRVVSYWHDMDEWQPERTVRAGPARIYLWRIPPRGGD